MWRNPGPYWHKTEEDRLGSPLLVWTMKFRNPTVLRATQQDMLLQYRL